MSQTATAANVPAIDALSVSKNTGDVASIDQYTAKIVNQLVESILDLDFARSSLPPPSLELFTDKTSKAANTRYLKKNWTVASSPYFRRRGASLSGTDR